MNKTYYKDPSIGGSFSQEVDGIRQIAAGGTGGNTARNARSSLKILGSSDWLAFEHFMFGTISPFAGSMTWNGTGAGALASTSVAGYQGVNTFTTGASSGAGSSSLAVTPTSMPLDLAVLQSATFATRVRFSQFPLDNSVSDGAVFRAGFMSQRNAVSSTGAYFEFTGVGSPTASPTLRCIIRNNGVETLYTLTTAQVNALFSGGVPSSWVDLKIEIYSGSYPYTLFIWQNADGVGTSRYIPTVITAGNKTGYGLHVAKSSGANGYDVQADYVYVKLSPTQETL